MLCRAQHERFGAPAGGAAAVEQFASEASAYLELAAKLRKHDDKN
jgi:hypothetical protein